MNWGQTILWGFVMIFDNPNCGLFHDFGQTLLWGHAMAWPHSRRSPMNLLFTVYQNVQISQAIIWRNIIPGAQEDPHLIREMMPKWHKN